VLLIITYGLGLVFELKTHRELFRSVRSRGDRRSGMAIGVGSRYAGKCHCAVALVSEMFVESVQQAASTLGIFPAFVGFIIVGLVGSATEMASALSAARKGRGSTISNA
jgi:Ca2+:H+ antiporter